MGLMCARSRPLYPGIFRDDEVHVGHEMHSAFLPAGVLEYGADRFLQPGVGIGDDKLHPVEASNLQRSQERRAEPIVLGVSDVEAEYFPAPISSNPGHAVDCFGDGMVTAPRFTAGRATKAYPARMTTGRGFFLPWCFNFGFCRCRVGWFSSRVRRSTRLASRKYERGEKPALCSGRISPSRCN
jgi:hypothetical protein